MSDIEFGVVQQPKGNGGKQSETETSTKEKQSKSTVATKPSGWSTKKDGGH